MSSRTLTSAAWSNTPIDDGELVEEITAWPARSAVPPRTTGSLSPARQLVSAGMVGRVGPCRSPPSPGTGHEVSPRGRGHWNTDCVPSSQVEVRRQYSRVDEVGIIDAVHESLVAAFKIPPGDRHVRLVVHEAHRFATAPRLSQPDRYTLVTIDCFAGRSIDAKRSLYQEIVDRLTPFGIPADHVTIVVRDSTTENWGIRGGRAACDVDLGFDIQV